MTSRVADTGACAATKDSVSDTGGDPGQGEVEGEEWAKPIVRLAHSVINHVLCEF